MLEGRREGETGKEAEEEKKELKVRTYRVTPIITRHTL